MSNPPTKVCTTCHKEKIFDAFPNDKSRKDGKRPQCKTCKSESDKQYKERNRDKCIEAGREYYKKNSDKIRQRASTWYFDNNERARASRREWYENNQDKVNFSRQRCKERNPDFYKEYMNNYIKERYKNDKHFRNKMIASSRLRKFINKKLPTLEYVGCSLDELCDWLEYQFTPEMSWDNQGTYWHVDHVKPCRSFDLSKESDVLACFHWSNLQPLSQRENCSKGGKVIEEMIKKHHEKYLNYLELKNKNTQ